MPHNEALRVAVDIGGTFTDAVVADNTGVVLGTAKCLTTHAHPVDGAMAAVADVLDRIDRPLASVGAFIHGTTLATNALIERRGATVATLTNEGFRDILEIAYERRYSQYDIHMEKPDLIVPRTRWHTVRGRMDVHGAEVDALDEAALEDLARTLQADGVDALAVCLLHAYANPAHEQRVRERLSALLPGIAIALSSEVSPEAREFDRLCTTIANACIQPLMAGYLAAFVETFERAGLRVPVLMMTSGGGMTTVETARRFPIRLVESGPAGGAVLAARVARSLGLEKVLSFDMGGTTAKLCLIDHGEPQGARHFEIARAERFIKGSGMPVRIPVIEMIEIGAGGGSIAQVDSLGRLRVGPRSAGSEPGPAAFGRGGTEATVTDADITLGYIDAGEYAEGRLAVDPAAAAAALQTGVGGPLALDAQGAARGVSDIVDEAMASASRMHAAESGKDLGDRTLIAFGGNGPLHATRVARRAGVRRIVVPLDPGVGSALGFLHAPVAFEIVRSRYVTLEAVDWPGLNAMLADMEREASGVVAQGTDAPPRVVRVAFMRYRGQGHEVEIVLEDGPLGDSSALLATSAFEQEYARQFGRAVPGMVIEVLNWAVRVSAGGTLLPAVAEAANSGTSPSGNRDDGPSVAMRCDLTGRQVTGRRLERASLRAGDRIPGPALITEPQTTTLVSADFVAAVDGAGNLVLERHAPRGTTP